MLKNWYCQIDVSLTITPVDPILIRSGSARPTGSDMQPVAVPLRDGSDQYYLPGTSLKGVFRSHLERIGRTVAPGSVCIPYYDPHRTDVNSIPVEDQRTAYGCSYLLHEEARKSMVYQQACPICRIFGLLGFAGRIAISDAIPVAGASPALQTRDGVGIDRITGGSAGGALFNQDVLVGGRYVATIRMTNFELWQLSALFHLFQDLGDGMLQIGSGRSRGLGRITAAPSAMSISWINRNHLPAASPQQLCGLRDFSTDAVRDAYGLVNWQPDPRPELPEGVRRGLRTRFEISDWKSLFPASMSEGFVIALDAHAQSATVRELRRQLAGPVVA